ncbi:B-cell lymphoma 3 protein isoform X2 [Varanus komodoensis]|nr:B-cell lymphoma 3 protein isoform X2 [Varanus komodoensis]
MAGELPVDLRTWRKGGGPGRWIRPDGEAAAATFERPSPEMEASFGRRVSLASQHRPCGETEGAPDSTCQPGPGVRSTASPQVGLEGEKKAQTCLPLRKRRFPATGLAGPFLSPELPPLLHPMTPHPLVGVPTHYSLLCPVEAQLALDIATATKQDEDGDTPLHIAVVQGNLPVAQRLVALFRQGQRDLDIFNKLQQTPLHLAVITSQPSLVKLLLSHGASPMVLDRNGQTSLHLACEHASLRCLKDLLQGNAALVDLEARNFEGFTPLHVAVGNSSCEAVLTLLEHGADIDAVDIKSGRSPLLHAVENNNLGMVELLLQHGANVNAQSYGGNTALHAASGRGLLDTLRLLVRNGADGSLKNYHNDTPLMVAKNKRVIDILRGKASRPGPPPDNIRDGSSPATSTTSSPGIRPAHAGLLRASPDSCPTTPSPAQTPKPHRAVQSPNSTNQKTESITSANGPSAPASLRGVKLERSPTPPALEQPAGLPGAPAFYLPVPKDIMDGPFHHATLYPFATSGHPLSSPHLQLLPIGLNHPVVPVPTVPLPGRIHPRGTEMDPSHMLLDLENPPASGQEGHWLRSHNSGPGGS